MTRSRKYTQIPIQGLRALATDEAADIAVYLQHAGDSEPVLYRQVGTELKMPNFDRLRAQGLRGFHVRQEDLRQCEDLLESHLREVLEQGGGTDAERAELVAHVGTRVAHDLSAGPDPKTGLTRATNMLDTVVALVLSDPHVASNMLRMAAHESGVASHMFVVSTLAVMFGDQILGLNSPELYELGMAGMMHDIGKLSLAAALLNKDGKLDAKECELIKQHPIESVRLLGDDPAITDRTRRMILEHHERIDGRGYPLGLTGHELSVGSRILSIVDTFHALTGRRSYRPSATVKEALTTMRHSAGLQLDADLLRCWCDYVERIGVSEELDIMLPTDKELPTMASRHDHRVWSPRRKMYGNRARRFECHTKRSVRCIHVGAIRDEGENPREFVAMLRDASRSGVCLHLRHPLYRGEMLNILVNGNYQKTWVRGVVAWSNRDRDSCFRVGVQFLHRVDEATIRRKVPIRTMAELEEVLFGTRAVVDASRPDAPAGQVMSNAGRTRDSSGDEDHYDEHHAMERLQAAKCERVVSPELANEVIELSKSGSAEVRKKSVSVLAKINSRKARAALVGLIADTSPEVVSAAADAAGLLQLHEASGKLRKLLTSEDESLALRAASSLGQLGDESVMPFIVRMVVNDGPHTRLATRMLGTILGKRFPANAEGVSAARRYIEATSLAKAS